ncbi:MAG: DNA mismatch repair endonuclease MutL [Piscirickettsiaceae bacterium]|nr:DNA mismatch repair endonuclease MutL [Piscirickettsiaceae bacterium]
MSDNSRIHALPLNLANQIAAGEVIERPASVLKELVENSIDAGATQITIDIEGAGSQLIRVSDNGFGIHPDDLPLALSRHATSKLHSSEQLSHIASLGFRGEALPSIASISELTLSSRQADSDCAWQLTPNSTDITPSAHPLGSSVEVRNLFFNVPARRHFLKGNKTELHHITTTFYRLALSHFDIGFHYQPANATALKLPIADTLDKKQQRIAKLCGKTFITNSLYIEQQFDDIELHGWLGTAEAHRPQTDIHYFFINGRVIRDRVITHAIRQAYANLIPAGRYPAFVLYLTIPLDQVDINVHPTKHEVRFRHARLIHGLITRALQDALASEPATVVAPLEQTQRQQVPLDYIAEKSQQYQIHASKEQAATTFNSVISVLHQRYIIADSEHGPMLIDLQLAEQSLRQQQLHQAIQTNTLRSRPILVPIRIELEHAQCQKLSQYKEILARLAITFKTIECSIVVESIPSLLTQVDIKQLINALLSAINDNQTSLEQLEVVLQQQCPMIAIQTLQQAESILKQLPSSDKTTNWSQILDQQTLSSLF